ncbi:hypothetical protein [Haloarcula sp. 1CSR25-25]|uniref:hypothetical protein n=1 Tax=Haloarcula sp. 1CSR25-25 TaxID=2862545 RepID=UPI0028939D19|nr:hypothetical protein [Haloarcula sp. 1CSR25-25]MDT3434771.1 hypothetical protein [Haloarcula sp. 1CSR25-25]
MIDSSITNRRTVLQTAGGLIAGSVLLTEFQADSDGQEDESQDEQQDLPSMIESHGHYSWFPLGPESWGRKEEPYDMEEGESRWLAEPTDEGGVRILVSNLGTEPPNRNAGFDVHLGSVGELETITIDARTLQTPNTTGPAVLFLGLFLDIDDNGEFLTWETTDGIERPTGPGNDDEGVAFYGANGAVIVDGDTSFRLINKEIEATLAELQNGSVEGITGETAAGLYVGAVNGGEGTDEIVVDDVRVSRS